MVQDMSDFSALNGSDEPRADQEGQRRRQKLSAMLRGRWHWAIIAALVLATLGAVGGFLSREPKYRGMGTIDIHAARSGVLSLIIPVTDDYSRYVQGEMSLLTSRFIVEEAMKSAQWQELEPALRTGLDADTLSDTLSTRRDGETVRLEAWSSNPKVAATLVNSVLEAYHRDNTARADAEYEEVLRRLDVAIRKNDIDINNEERNVQSTLYNMGMEAAQEAYRTAFAELAALREQQERLDAQWEDLAAGRPIQIASNQELVKLDAEFADLVQRRDAQANAIERARIGGMGDDHRTMKGMVTNLNMLDRLIEGRRAAVMAGGGGDLKNAVGPMTQEELARRRAEVNQAVFDQEKRTQDLSDKLETVKDRNAKIATMKTQQALLLDRKSRVEIENTATDRVEIKGRAVPSTEPDNLGKRLQMGLLGGLFGGAMGFGLVMMLGLLDRKLRHVEQARVDLPDHKVLGMLPTLPQDLSDPEQATLAAHGVHHIRTLLQIDHMNDGRGRAFSITSPAAGSGKSSLTMALGLSFAASGARTLLIDCDVVGGGLTRRLGAVKHEPLEPLLLAEGLVDEETLEEARVEIMGRGGDIGEVLVEMGRLDADDLARVRRDQDVACLGLLEACNGQKLEECTIDSGVPRLSVLPLGDAQPHEAGALSPAAIRRLIGKTRELYDVVLIDTGPVLGSLEASMAAAEADATLFVVSRGDNRVQTTRSLEHLQSIGANIAGLVFNHAGVKDIQHSKYGSMSVTSRRPSSSRPPALAPDPEASKRFGPLASAVACYGSFSRSAAVHTPA